MEGKEKKIIINNSRRMITKVLKEQNTNKRYIEETEESKRKPKKKLGVPLKRLRRWLFILKARRLCIYVGMYRSRL